MYHYLPRSHSYGDITRGHMLLTARAKRGMLIIWPSVISPLTVWPRGIMVLHYEAYTWWRLHYVIYRGHCIPVIHIISLPGGTGGSSRERRTHLSDHSASTDSALGTLQRLTTGHVTWFSQSWTGLNRPKRLSQWWTGPLMAKVNYWTQQHFPFL